MVLDLGLLLIVLGLIVVVISALPYVMPGRYRIFAVILGIVILLGGFYMVSSPSPSTQQIITPSPQPTIALSQLAFVSPTAGVTLNPNSLSATIPVAYNSTQIKTLGTNTIAYGSKALVKEIFVIQRSDTLSNASVWKITVSTPAFLNTTSGKSYPYIYQNTTSTYAIGINGVWGSPTYLLSLPSAGMQTVTVAFYLNYAGVSNLALGQSFVITITVGNQTVTNTFVITGTS